MRPELSLAISPCPNDTFIFHAMIHGLAPVDPGFTLSGVTLADVEELNALAARGGADVVKISLAAIPDAVSAYRLLSSGSALGRGCGPLLVTRRGRDPGCPIERLALPGRRTTAALLAELAGIGGEREYVRYDRIMDAVAQGRADAGVLIHEGRFTFADHGLDLLLDFGRWWEDRFGLPLPLGVIAARRSLGPELVGRVEAAVRASLEYARAHPEASRAYVGENAQELSEAVTARHIETFVTDFSLDVGDEGERAVAALAGAAFRLAGAPDASDSLYA